MSSMSYCQFENGADEMRGVLSKLISGEVSDWSEYEIRAVKRIFDLAESITELKDDVLNEIENLEEEED